MYILSINTSHDAGASLYKDYERLASVAQERMSRKKSDGYYFPKEAVVECLKQAAIDLSQVDKVCLPYFDFPARFLHPEYFKEMPLIAEKIRLGSEMKDDTHNTPLSGMIFRYNRKFGPDKKIEDPSVFLDSEAYVEYFFGRKIDTFFYIHHDAHALSALFHSPWDDGLIYTVDGWGDWIKNSCRVLRDGKLTELFGGWQDVLDFTIAPFLPEPTPQTYQKFRSIGLNSSSLAGLYANFTKWLGWIPSRHEGKVLGLAAFGKPVFKDTLKSYYEINGEGIICIKEEYKNGEEHLKTLQALIAPYAREDIAASLQKAVEELTLEALAIILAKHKPKNIALSGGFFANVVLNQRIIEKFNLDEIFIYPAMGDSGQSAGGVLQFLLHRDGLEHWLAQRKPLTDVYFGKDYDREIETAFDSVGAVRMESPLPLSEQAASLIQDGKICALYQGRMEYGPRALGNRSIIAAPSDRKINDWLNKRLSRTEFMPFAPVVRKERATEIFDLPENKLYAARFMTITCNVKTEWRDKIPAVVHVDGTARPQVLEREHNPLYYDILHKYEKESGIPVLINTSFNAHEEPIINTPMEAARALKEGRVDFVITPKGIYRF